MCGEVSVRPDGSERAEKVLPYIEDRAQVRMRITRIHAVICQSSGFSVETWDRLVRAIASGHVVAPIGQKCADQALLGRVAVRVCFELIVHFFLFDPCNQRKSF
jgi:hypothetical protein